jgi:hypothetical protein
MINSKQFGRRGILVAVVAAMVSAQSAVAATCNVPSAPHPTIQEAIDDIGCTEIVVAAGTFTEAPVVARTLSVQGAGSGSTFVQGQVEVSAGVVSLTGLNLAAPSEALWAHSGAEVSGFDLEVVNGFVETPFFADGFESGGTGAWAVVVP